MDNVLIVEYDPQWPRLFAEEAARLWQALGKELIVAIEHIGSTAVPRLVAKPVIDIMVGVHSLEQAETAIPVLELIGYVHWRDDPRPGRMFFVKGMPPYGKERTHHIHIVEAHGEFWQRKLFRDYLRSHPEEAKRYELLKRDLATRFPQDRERYTEGKHNYIEAVMAKVRSVYDLGLKSDQH